MALKSLLSRLNGPFEGRSGFSIAIVSALIIAVLTVGLGLKFVISHL